MERVSEEAVERTEMLLLAYCVMPNHWHLVVWPPEHGQLSQFTGWLTLTPKVAEGKGFEPLVGVNRRRFSRPVKSLV